MIKNYFKIAIRSLRRNNIYSLINIFGLSFGMACSILILLWVQDELQMDRFHTNSNLFRVIENQYYAGGEIFNTIATPSPMAPYLKENYPEIVRASRITWIINNLFTHGELAFYEKGYYVDPDFLQMFSYPFIEGDSKTALNDINAIVISSRMADKFFEGEHALGKVLQMNEGEQFKVTGIIEVPKNSSLQFDFLLPFDYFYRENESWLQSWGNNNVRTYLQLNENARQAAVEKKISGIIPKHIEESNTDLFLQAYKEAYLYSTIENGKINGGRIEYVRIFSIVAFFILVIACINFMNLSTAQAARRAKEVGLRKVVGAVKSQLITQFIGESLLLAFLAIVFASFIVALMIPSFNELTAKQLTFNLDWNILMILLGVAVFTGMVAGSYPALFMSGFQPAKVLKGSLNSSRGAALFRKVLVVVQFSLSIILIISTLVVFRQLNFIQNKDIGFNKENVVYIPVRQDMKGHYDAIKSELERHPAIDHITAGSTTPLEIGNSSSGFEWEGKDEDNEILFSFFSIHHDFIETMGMSIKEGRSFNQKFTADTSNFLINEEAAKRMGFSGQIVGEPLEFNEKNGTIVGVVKDFNFQSIKQPIEPIIMLLAPDDLNYIMVKVKGDGLNEAIKALENVHSQYAGAYPFEYHFLDQDWENMYQIEHRIGKIFNYFAFLSILISCLGLFGLAAYSAEQRTKEIGVRKVLGASVFHLAQLMTKDFTVLVIIAAAIACPVAWFMMDSWLSDFAYHIELDVFTLITATVLAFVIAILTVSYQAIKASLADPVKSLRYE